MNSRDDNEQRIVEQYHAYQEKRIAQLRQNIERTKCVNPTTELRIVRMDGPGYDAPKKLQQKFSNGDGTAAVWRDVPTVSVSTDRFYRGVDDE